MDCTDFRCREPWPFIKEISTIWFSHKFKGPGLRYEIAISISTGDIVWANGPFPCGVPDLKIFRQNLRRQLTPGEKVVADQGYKGNTKILTTLDSKDDDHKKGMSRLRARQETVNARIRTWGCLRQTFRHHRDKHHLVTRAILAMTQVSICNGHPLFQVDTYSDPMF